MELIISASLITAFFAGIAALFAPCCITVLLPTYFASIFRQKTKVFLMTFVFFLGILIIFLPLGLGFGKLGGLITQFHNPIYFLGGVFLILLGLAIIFGWHFSLPLNFKQKLNEQNIASVFVLGIFSGLSTTCCAPVLAGVLALSILPGSIFWGGMYSFIYVLGMTLPLFLIAMFLDQSKITERLMLFKRTLDFSFFKRRIHLTIANLISGLMFLIMGALILILLFSGRLQMSSSLQIKVNIYLGKFLNLIEGFIQKIPGALVFILIILLFLVILTKVIRQIRAR